MSVKTGTPRGVAGAFSDQQPGGGGPNTIVSQPSPTGTPRQHRHLTKDD